MEEIDEDFEKELAAVLTDYKLPPSGPFPQAVASTSADSRQTAPSSTVSFRVMMRRGGRDDKSKAVQVQQPASSSLRSFFAIAFASIQHICVTEHGPL